MYRLKSVFCLIQAFLMIVSSFSVYDSNFKRWVDRAAMEVTSVSDSVFGRITSDEICITAEEKDECRNWYNRNVLTEEKPAYDFTVGGRKLRNNLKDWTVSIGPESEEGAVYRGGRTSYVTLTHRKSSLEAVVEATIYEDYATCEWTVYIENKGTENSPVIKNFYAADCRIDTGVSDIYFSKGSEPSAEDFELMKSALCSTAMKYNANGGRSESWLPFFNVCGKKCGVVVTNGWTGQWYSSFRQTVKGVEIKEKQEFFKGYLTPGEKVRSPLVSVTFYNSGNPLKGFNALRNWERNCVYTESAKCITCTVLAGEFDMSTDKQFIDRINAYDDSTCEKTDYLWKDAGWYKMNTDWYDSVGNWTPDPERFPDGYGTVSEAAEARGMKSLLWYEPERCCKDTDVYNECKKHNGWLIECSDEVNMVNLAMDGACEYLGNLIANSLKENKIGLYRQDFNFEPLALWQDADKTLWGGRTGFEENHYVSNLYRFLDTLLLVNPGLVIDNCASGGKRLDIEMSRRSIPLWRTDFNCSDSEGHVREDALEGTQSISYGISFWLPLTGTGLAGDGEYLRRTLITPCTQRVGYEEIRAYMDKNYYPLTYGARDLSCFHAMQYGTGDEGTALIYKREKVTDNVYRLILNGLSPDKSYTVSDCDGINASVTGTGSELMSEGIPIIINETPKAVIIEYRSVSG